MKTAGLTKKPKMIYCKYRIVYLPGELAQHTKGILITFNYKNVKRQDFITNVNKKSTTCDPVHCYKARYDYLHTSVRY